MNTECVIFLITIASRHLSVNKPERLNSYLQVQIQVLGVVLVPSPRPGIRLLLPLDNPLHQPLDTLPRQPSGNRLLPGSLHTPPAMNKR